MKRHIRTRIQLTASVLAVLTCWLGTEAWAYTSTLVKDGATVHGIVTVTETTPAPQEFELRRFPDHEYCSKLSDGSGFRLLREVTARPDGGLKDVVVVVEGVERGKPFSVTNAKVEATLCQFLPFVTVVGNTRRVTVFNRDPVPHDIQGFVPDQPGNEKVFSRPSLRARGTTDLVRLAEGHHVFTMQCSMHPYMQNWGYAVDTPYYAVTDATGSFSIEDLPPGTYRLKAWHPILGTQEQELNVAPNETVSLELSFKAKF
ncbi:MAG: carboxypeptidase regulatory-like domain-containing protein [Nitrospira sp.]|nr:carboxypeptidase regulatory-like domain-containing protein [Nitrospira sp.]